MTERDLLHNLLETPPEHGEQTVAKPLSPAGERALMRAAVDVGPVTLQSETPDQQPEAISDVMGFVRRYPMQTALVVAGAAYLLARRRR